MRSANETNETMRCYQVVDVHKDKITHIVCGNERVAATAVRKGFKTYFPEDDDGQVRRVTYRTDDGAGETSSDVRPMSGPRPCRWHVFPCSIHAYTETVSK